jgi:hypothetical protein
LWVKKGTRWVALIALLIILIGLVVLGLPDRVEGAKVVQWSSSHSLRVADLIGALMVGGGTLLVWATVLAWQRAHIGE